MHTKEIGAKAVSRAVCLGTSFKLFACFNRTVLIQNGANLAHPSGCQWLMKNSQILIFFFCYNLAFEKSPEIACQKSVEFYQ